MVTPAALLRIRLGVLDQVYLFKWGITDRQTVNTTGSHEGTSWGSPRWLSDKESTCQGRGCGSLGWEDPLEEEMETHSSILVWKIPWTEEPGRLLSMGLQRVGCTWAHTQMKVLSRQRCFGLRFWGWEAILDECTYLLILITKQNFITVQAGSRKAAHSHLAVGGQIETQIMNLFDSVFISLALLNMP